MKPTKKRLTRRSFVRLAGLSAGAVAGQYALGGPGRVWASEQAQMTSVAAKDRKLLFVLCAYGGASIIDAFMPVAESEVADLFLAPTLNVFPDFALEQRLGSNIRTPAQLADYTIYQRPKLSLADFLASHGSDVAVIGHDVSSVNHTVGQQRSLNGAGTNGGRTLMEAMALRYGGGTQMPSINMAADGYARHGSDGAVPLEARHELITAPLLFGAGTHGYRGIEGEPSDDLMARARQIRGQVDSQSVFARTFAGDPRLRNYLQSRDEGASRLEGAELLQKLLLLDTGRGGQANAMPMSPTTKRVREMLPNLENDKVESQVALAFLMAYYGSTVSAVMGFPTDPYIAGNGDIEGAPIAFDFSHASHRTVQSLMWGRVAIMLDKLITLLKTHDYLGDPSLGKMWDRSLVYVATEFGRDKIRPPFAGDWGTGHNLNNGSVLISPLIKGNAVYGGVDPKTCRTYGCDLNTGEKTPGSFLNEAHVYGAIAQALDLEAPGAPRFPALVRG